MWAVILGSHQPYHASACWIFSEQDVAERFAAYVTAEIDPAQVVKALDPVSELLTWRDNQQPGSPFDLIPAKEAKP
jgi:hypothetical protein